MTISVALVTCLKSYHPFPQGDPWELPGGRASGLVERAAGFGDHQPGRELAHGVLTQRVEHDGQPHLPVTARHPLLPLGSGPKLWPPDSVPHPGGLYSL
eukprot:scaffold106042_cov42-Prasinocladus_malaysianus.AAC.7